ncbi:MAG: flavodoxin-dependent (E)-4-hydroxy-3-methylbut-2-enyl-diphosphate synthase [Dehalobacter sp.]|uniref:4-hydroxy-3-methylbut-2-en-1-yl diphosphate synthase (flavodoxin) n=2 Tax=Dehalobacter restrictus TaxID=55583 RepID=A0A857DG00_9FIRM|nr:flavodoxin-dependent (E)-4-hydroxy-3-methylbut-2-enyl-diphosphate synthase [Dehalobacter restrictus]AHF09618.1 4-hydroxy-3-methylbut-2-en-1-yl diphosphate synthase [Dehalobacter restrictus DSM 9455]MCG1026555.1 flavodoxin-dependent (E)-4-hydroxy-3-methylbut-2-enyl-diphosphate synthase [Dehalobacter sp.]QHA00210.1 flavodoxin-dependent (E)-4-hydroxy-3-methylbut-2-enyl-diphosphate synthase [Dehalobacter restrictus]
MKRRITREVKIGSVAIGGSNPVVIQSMTNTDTRDVQATLNQIRHLAGIGCEIIRIAVLNEQAALALKDICSLSPIPVVADIHFDYRLALKAVANGVHGLRINPGNIGERWKVQEVINAVRERNIPIRIGVNTGSLEKEILEKYGGPTAEGMVESALGHVGILEQENYHHIKISLKSSHVPLMIDAYRMIAHRVDYPLHVGVTEAGTVRSGVVKSAIGIGTLLAEGIGDTIRVSLTGDPAAEIPVAQQILRVLDLKKGGFELISCPTCGRTQVDLVHLAEEVEQRLEALPAPSKSVSIAVMGCVVNGPGEAREADFGIAGGKGRGLLFARGEVIAQLPEDELVPALMEKIEDDLSLSEKH